MYFFPTTAIISSVISGASHYHVRITDPRRGKLRQQQVVGLLLPVGERASMYNLDDLHIAVTNKCNMHCMHCYSSSGSDEEEEIPLSVIRRLILQLQENFKFTDLTISGGEPLLPEKLDKTLELAHFSVQRGLRLRLVTNGSCVTAGVARALAGICSPVQISLDSVVPEVHDTFRGFPGAFRSAVRGIKHLVSEGIETHVRHSLTSDNVEQVCETYRLVNSLGVHKFFVKPVFPCGRASGQTEMMVPTARLKHSQAELLELSCSMSTKLALHQPFLLPETFCGNYNAEVLTCACGRSMVYIDSRGKVYPCVYVTNMGESYCAGSILDPDFDIVKAWHTHNAFKAYRQSATGNVLCPTLDKLLGRNYLQSGNPQSATKKTSITDSVITHKTSPTLHN